MIVRMHRPLASERRARELAAAIGDHLVDIHIELSAAASHPYMQREHVVMLAGEDFVAGLNDQLIPLVVEPLAVMVCCSSSLLQNRIGCDHLSRNQILPNAEMLKRTLRLRAPQFVGVNINLTQTIGLLANVHS